MFCHYFGMFYFVPFLVLQWSWRAIRSWLLCFNCLPGVLFLLIFSGSSSKHHVFVWSVWMWYITNKVFQSQSYKLVRECNTYLFGSKRLVWCTKVTITEQKPTHDDTDGQIKAKSQQKWNKRFSSSEITVYGMHITGNICLICVR